MMHSSSFLIYRSSMPVFGCRLFNPQYCLRRCLSTSTIKVKNTNHAGKHRNGFGIVAAMTSNQVIGVNGSLPWKNLIQDKNHFINLTRNKVLICGRRTFALEDPSLAHIRHCRACIVVSGTMNQEDLIKAKAGSELSDNLTPELMLARSFDEALELANAEKHKKRTLQSDYNENTDNNENAAIDCWVAGGEAIYREALQHADAVEVQLTHVDMMVDTNQFGDVAYFPLGHMNTDDDDVWTNFSLRRVGECEFKVWRKNNPLLASL